jgi:hypothetical protein
LRHVGIILWRRTNPRTHKKVDILKEIKENERRVPPYGYVVNKKGSLCEAKAVFPKVAGEATGG